MDAVWTSGKEGDVEGGSSRAASARTVYGIAMSSTWTGRGQQWQLAEKIISFTFGVLFRFVFEFIESI